MSLDRPLEIAAFLDQHQWGEAQCAPVAADFSPRRYARLTKASGHTAILMDADSDQKTAQFVDIARLLSALRINAPEIYAADIAQGFVLMQDLGSRNVGALLDEGAAPRPFFIEAAHLLADLHQRFDRSMAVGLDLPLFNAHVFTTQAELFLDIYVPHHFHCQVREDERADFRAAWAAVLRPLETMEKSLLLRDFMPDNLMALPENDLGVLDFQDGGIGCVAYDLASLCEVARRDGGFDLLPEVIHAYRERRAGGGRPFPSATDLVRAASIFSAQRHTRHLGNIARAALNGKSEKMILLPRIAHHLQTLLKEPYLMPVKEWMDRLEVKGP